MADDAQLKDYMERLVSRLAAASEVSDHRLVPLVIDNPVLNAFAAPGGIIGVNTGLFIYAETEAQFAAVLAHELAHLSQRHYARNVEDARNKSIPTAAAIPGSIIIMATAGGDAGAAALTSTVAGIQSSRLRFSRQFERIDQALKNNPTNYPLLATRAQIFTIQQEHGKAKNQLLQLSRMRPEDPDIWYELAEAQGLDNDILGLHQSRAEFFFLTGNIDDAIKHLQYARKMVGNNFALKSKLDQKLADMYSYRQKIKSG